MGNNVAALVDRLAVVYQELNALAARKSSLQAEWAALEARIIAAGRWQNTLILEGYTARVGLEAKVAVQLPTKQREIERYNQLDQALRSSGVWPAVSCFDRYALHRIWTGRQRDPGNVRRLIAPYVVERVQTKVKILSTALD